ncbi:carbohydrate-binding domain-containing protein [Mycobacterium sp. 134]|uniref:carbohydrate-binding domain-containing protein n=1 Tax=Mycobacterium sp. 134 TaxID=3400425 RepID=UPI003AAD9938
MPAIRPIIAGVTTFAIALSITATSAAAGAVLDADTLAVNPTAAGAVLADSTAAGGTALRLSQNSTAATTLELPAASRIVVRAKGTQCLGGPSMIVSVDGKTIGTTIVQAASWTDYTVTATGVAGTHNLGISFANDFALNVYCDRNLLLDKITVVDTGSGNPTTTAVPTTTANPPTTTAPSGSATRAAPFAVSSPFRTAIPVNAAVDSKSVAMVARIARDNAMYANLVEFGVPIYTATASSPRYSVTCRITTWGPCPFAGAAIPIPAGARPSPGSDGAMVVVDETTQRSYEFWQAKLASGKWSASWGSINSLGGSGWGGNSTAAGASRLGGVIQIAEIAAGTIPHALAIQIDNTCAGVFRAPAIKTDGSSTRSDCIPEGARVRLDPTVDLGSLRLAPAVLAVARALQVYGAYVVDTGGSPLSVSFEMDPAATASSIGSVYQQAGLRWDYDNLPGIPYSRLQVLAS